MRISFISNDKYIWIWYYMRHNVHTSPNVYTDFHEMRCMWQFDLEDNKWHFHTNKHKHTYPLCQVWEFQEKVRFYRSKKYVERYKQSCKQTQDVMWHKMKLHSRILFERGFMYLFLWSLFLAHPLSLCPCLRFTVKHERIIILLFVVHTSEWIEEKAKESMIWYVHKHI